MDPSKKDHPLFRNPGSSERTATRGGHSGVAASDLDLEEAETALLDQFDSRSRGSKSRKKKKSDTPPPTEVAYSNIVDETSKGEGADEPAAPPSKAKLKFQSMVRKVALVHRMSQSNVAKLESVRKQKQQRGRGHRKQASRAHEMLNYIQDIDNDSDESDEEEEALFGTGADNADSLFVAADLAPNNESDEMSVISEGSYEVPSEQLPLVGSAAENAKEKHQAGYDTLAAGIRSTRKQRQTTRWKRRMLRLIAYLCDAGRAWSFFRDNIIYSYFTCFGLPCFVISWVLFYYVGNPASFEFVPGHATMSWWFNFFGRQVVTLELTRITEWLLLDTFILGTKVAVRYLGPLVTLTAIQAKGWPFLVGVWALWDLLLLHGTTKFQIHWMYWTGLRIYSVHANSGGYILSHDHYLRILLAFLAAGLCTTAKRAFVAIYFGRRQLVEFKPRMEKLLADVVLLTEVATLAEEAVVVTEQNSSVHGSLVPTEESMDFLGDESAASDGLQAPGALLPAKRVGFDILGSGHKGKGLGSVALASEITFDHEKEEEAEEMRGQRPERIKRDSSSGSAEMNKLQRRPSGSFRIKDMLDRWNEPVNKGDKAAQSSISDVLKFRRALTYMDDDYPFGEAFGPANDRNASIESANDTFQRLLKLTPAAYALGFDILLLALRDEEEEEDSDKYTIKQKALRRLFQPDVNNELPMLAFVQSCDAIYKRLRYFRASVTNSSVIDKVLEDILNGFFYFILVLLLMSLVNFNPWPILVSITSLLVSVSFALGPSVSKYVEGVLLIAVRRPYDLGDRIFVTGAEVVNNPGPSASWFVEDINIFNTTLRYSKTNEVSTVNNWSIASSRIVNCNRSPNAIILIDLFVHIGILEGTLFEQFRKALDEYVDEHPRTWDSVAFVRTNEFDSDTEKVTLQIAFRHRNSWQDATRIFLNRADLLRYVYETCKSLGIQFESPPARRVMYRGGVVVNTPIVGHRRDTLVSNNILGESNAQNDVAARPTAMTSPSDARFGKDVSTRDIFSPTPGG